MTLHLVSLAGGYGDTLIHRDLSYKIPKGHVAGVVGRNGMGKTTLARLLAGFLPLQAGQVFLDDQDLSPWPAWRRAQAGIATMGQTGFVFDRLSVCENLALTRARPQELDAMLALFPRLKQRSQQVAGSMSGGERKILGFVCTLLLPSQVLILDEPSEGIQPENIAKMQKCIQAQSDAGKSVILMEQNIAMIEAVAQSALLITGRGKTQTLEGPDLRRANLLQALQL